jgi:uncharacterized protein (DUF1778 family)
MPKSDPKSDQLLAKAKRFRDRAAGFRHTLARDDVPRNPREKLETMVLNLEGAARQLEAMAGGAVFEAEGSAAEEIRKLRGGAPLTPERAALIRNARNVRNARVASQVLNAAARGGASPPPKPPRKRGT